MRPTWGGETTAVLSHFYLTPSLCVDRTTRLGSGVQALNAIANEGSGERLFDAIPDSVNAINATGEEDSSDASWGG